MGEGFLRVFVALDIGEAVRALLAEEIKALKKTHPRVKWVASANIHLTLAFLGEIPQERLAAIGVAMDGVAVRFAPFACRIKGLGWFGAPRSPRVVWAGGVEVPELMQLQAGTADALRQLGLTPEDRPFHPHLTLGRVKSSRDAAGLPESLSLRRDVDFGLMPVDRLSVMRSELQPQGPVYSVLHEARLRTVAMELANFT